MAPPVERRRSIGGPKEGRRDMGRRRSIGSLGEGRIQRRQLLEIAELSGGAGGW